MTTHASASRLNNSPIGRWWWTIDRPVFLALLTLIVVGLVMVAAASPAVAVRIGLPPFYFVHRHQFFLLLALGVMVVTSFLSPTMVRRAGVIGFGVSLLLMVAVLFVGDETKGAHRWLSLGGLNLQPSELMKPCFAVVIAWVCAERLKKPGFPGNKVAIALYLITVLLLILQPDFGMVVTVTAMWGIQFFLAGLPMFWVLLLGVLALCGVFAAYHLLPHVASRIDRFLNPESGDNYQVEKSLEAFHSGGILGRGPGEGKIKHILPDSHTDFVFSVAGEEFGLIACTLIAALFAFVVLKSLSRVWQESDLYVVLAVAGLSAQFGMQAMINMGVAVNLLPAKGMTLPFLSYGGSSVIAIALGMGMLLALTRKRYGNYRRVG